MAKKTTTPTGSNLAKPKTDAPSEIRKLGEEIRNLEERQASRAVDRAIRWARLADQLETLLDRADDLFTYGLPVDIEDVKRFHADLQLDPEMAGCDLGHARSWLVFSTTSTLAVDLQLAENWLPMIGDEYRTKYAFAIADVRLRLEGKPHDLMTTPAEAIAFAITHVRKLLRVDLVRARLGARLRSPSNFETEVLRALLSASRRLSGEELAKVVQRKTGGNTQTQAIFDAVSKLRLECGFEIPRNDAGYTLSDNDRDQAAALCIVV
jgi:hypothetical protein